jgi:phosphatidylglycerophosphatase B
MLPALALLTLTYVVPLLNPYRRPHLDLTGPFAVAAYWVAESGGTMGIPLIGIALTALLVCRSGVARKQRASEVVVIVLAVAFLLGGAAFLNEHVVKPFFAVPRPNVIELATTPSGAPVLGMSAEAFYAMPSKASRSAYLSKILAPTLGMDERIRGHWIAESGYSFPSGHSFSSMMFATFFLGMGLSTFSGRWRWLFYLSVPWAVAVCVSRPLLRVHSPTDVCVGGLEGIVVGILAFLLVQRILAVLAPLSVKPLPEDTA